MARKFTAVILIAIFTLCISSNFYAKNSADYIYYHKNINYAEELFFAKGKSDSAMFYYKNVFGKFDFVFLRDCIIAMQIALFKKDEPYFLYFTEKACKNGLHSRNISKYKFIYENVLYKKNAVLIQNYFAINRPEYLRRIDTNYLRKVISLFANDQLEKNPYENETRREHEKRYQESISSTIIKLKELVLTKGLPSDKLIGISQNDIMKELGLMNSDLIYYYYRNKHDTNIREGQFTFQEEFAASEYLIPLLWHNKCYDSSFQKIYKKEISSGNIHPRDVAAIEDFMLENNHTFQCPIHISADTIYCNIFNHITNITISADKINNTRRQKLINSLEIDAIKRAYQKKYGMHLFFGFLWCR